MAGEEDGQEQMRDSRLVWHLRELREHWAHIQKLNWVCHSWVKVDLLKTIFVTLKPPLHRKR